MKRIFDFTYKENILPIAEKCYQNLPYLKQNAYKQLYTGKTDIISLSCDNMQKIKLRIYNPDEQETELNQPLSKVETELHQKVVSMRYCLSHRTQYPFEVIKDRKLFSQNELYRKGKPGHGLTTDSDAPMFGNTGFIFFHCFALGEKMDFSNRQEDLFFSDHCLMNEGYITLADGLGIYRTATYGTDQRNIRADHGNTLEYIVTNGTQKMDYLFEEKETGKTSVLPMTFGESHVFAPHIKEFLADIVILKYRRLSKDDQQSLVSCSSNTNGMSQVVNRLTSGIEAKIPSQIVFEGNLIGNSSRIAEAQNYLRGQSLESYESRIKREREYAEENSYYSRTNY